MAVQVKFDFYKRIIELLKRNETLSYQALFNILNGEVDGLTESMLSQSIRWLVHFKNIEEVSEDVYKLLDETEKRKNPPSANPRKSSTVRMRFSTNVPPPLNPNPVNRALQVNPSNDKRDIAPFFKQSEGHDVFIYHSPVVIEDVIHISLVFKDGTTFNLPAPEEDVRFETGVGIPEWSPNQATNYGAVAIRCVKRNGEIVDVATNENDAVTMDKV